MPLNFILPRYDDFIQIEKENNLFDWHTSNPIETMTDLNLKLSNFSFTDNNDPEKKMPLTKIKNYGEEYEKKIEDKDKDKDEGYFVDEKNILSELLKRTQGFSGAEMVAAVQEAGMLAIDGGADVLEISHLYTAIHGIIPQITPDVLAFYEKIAAEY